MQFCASFSTDSIVMRQPARSAVPEPHESRTAMRLSKGVCHQQTRRAQEIKESLSEIKETFSRLDERQQAANSPQR